MFVGESNCPLPSLAPPPPATISAGKSFHSVSGRAFWNDSDEVDDEDVVSGGLRGGPSPIGGRFTAAAVGPPFMLMAVPFCEENRACDGEEAGGGGGAPSPILRCIIHAVSGRSLK